MVFSSCRLSPCLGVCECCVWVGVGVGGSVCEHIWKAAPSLTWGVAGAGWDGPRVQASLGGRSLGFWSLERLP